MAVEGKSSTPAGQHAAGRRVVFGTNVLVVTVIVIGIVVVLQLMAYSASARWDWTSSGVNSLSDGTENLLNQLDTNVTLTSLYFETDREEEDQPRYRRAIDDLLGLYEANNRTHVAAEWVNPLKDHEKFKNLLKRLQEKGSFKEEIKNYTDRIAAFTDELDARIKGLLQGETERITALGGGMGSGSGDSSVARVEQVLRGWADEMSTVREDIDRLMFLDEPQYGAVVGELKRAYQGFAKSLNEIARFGTHEAASNQALSRAARDYLLEASERYAELIEAINAENEKLGELEPLKSDDLLRQVGPTANAVLVETDEDVLVVDFNNIWPPMDPNASAMRVSFRNRAFKGEEKVTAALLRAMQKEQTAVLFVRYGGQPLLLGGFMPGMPAAPFAAMKQQLEDANFIVKEWDLKTSDTPPEIDPTPTRTIYIVLKPAPPQQSPMGQPSQEPPFSEPNRRALLSTLGDSGRALFIAGWSPGSYGPMASPYEYDGFLNDTWGISVDTSTLLIEVGSIGPGKYHVTRRDFFNMAETNLLEHDIVSGPRLVMALPWCAPLALSDTPPEGVERFPLVIQPKREGVWGIHNISEYETQIRERNFMTLADGDLEGPFTLAAAAEKGDAKVVVISSRDFAVDGVAFARELAMGPEGFQLRSRNPGNVTLLINSLHWLNDNTQFHNVGRPIDLAVLEVRGASTVRTVQVLTIVVWPVLALVLGGVAWWIRRG